jgi:MFS family permease
MTTFSSLRFFNYRLWFCGALISNIGAWMQRIAQDWLVLTVLTHDSGVAVGVVTGLQFAPYLVLSVWAGVLADRLDHRRLLIATQLASGALGVGLGLLVLLGQVQLWHVYVFATLLGCVSAIDGPVRQTFVADLVPADGLSNAVGLNSASFNAARLIGPGAAGFMIAWVGTGWVFLTNGLTFAATVGALMAMRRSELLSPALVKRSKGQIMEGVRYVKGRTDIVAIMVVVGIVSMFGLNLQLTSALMARTEFGKGSGEYGILGSAIAVGTLTGALLAARRKRPNVPLVVGAALGFGLAEGAMALTPTYSTYAIACIPTGLAALTMMTAANATIQMTTPPKMRGRVMSLYMLVFLGVAPIGSPIVGWVGEHYGARWSIGIGAIASVVAALAAALWAIRRGKVAIRYRVHRPYVKVTYPVIRGSSAERAAREEAVLRIGAQEIEDAASQP